VRVRPETDFPERFEDLNEVRLELPDGLERAVHVRRARVTAKGIILALAESRGRDEAEALRGAWIKIMPSMAVALPKGRYWIHDIIGLHVFTEDGAHLGEVTEVVRTPAHDIYVTSSTMIPAVREMVREIDLGRGRMVVSMPPEYEPESPRGRP
jgi:16S rRNA processing protein RimM